jgi:hypothetical protein
MAKVVAEMLARLFCVSESVELALPAMPELPPSLPPLFPPKAYCVNVRLPVV